VKRLAEHAPYLTLTPREYFRRNCWAAVEGSEPEIEATAGLIGADRMCVSTDYPHFDSNFPHVSENLLKNVPREITEAARVDGCSRLGAMFRVVLPLSVPGILTICIFAFTLAMQEYVYALTFVSSSDEKMITLGVVTDLIRGDVFFWGSLMAGALIVSIPVAIVYNLFMDTFVRGITGRALQ